MSFTETKDVILSRLLPGPIAIQENGINGRLFVDGNLGGNRLLFRFLFDKTDEIVPVFLEVCIAGKRYRYLLSGRDLTNPMVKSPVLIPDASIADGLEILNVSPLVSVFKRKSEISGIEPLSGS